MDEAMKPDSGCDRVLEGMVNRYQRLLMRICYVYLHDMELAKDAVQETFLKAYRAMASFRGESSEKTWLIQIAVNTCRDMRRSAWFRHNDRRITPEDLPLSAVMPHDENDLDMMCHIMRLPFRLKEVIMLYYWQDMTVTEIAAVLNISHAAVSARLKQAREKIRAMLERREPNGR